MILKSLFDVIKQLFGLVKNAQDLRTDMTTMQVRSEKTTETLREAVFDIRSLKENSEREREYLALRLENILLRSDPKLLQGATRETPLSPKLLDQLEDLRREIEALKTRIQALEEQQ